GNVTRSEVLHTPPPPRPNRSGARREKTKKKAPQTCCGGNSTPPLSKNVIPTERNNSPSPSSKYSKTRGKCNRPAASASAQRILLLSSIEAIPSPSGLRIAD